MTTFERVLPIADTVLYEGYMLYPYRANDAKNRVRWQFGVLAPAALAQADSSERDHLQAELLLEGRPEVVRVRVRFIQIQRRTVQRRGADGFYDVLELRAANTTYLPFDEAITRELDVGLELADLGGTPRAEHFDIPGGVDVEHVPGGQLRRERLPLRVSVRLSAEALPGPYGVTRLRVVVSNETAAALGRLVERRGEALRSSLVAAHLLVGLEQGRLISLTDPPEWATGYVQGCENVGVWPVLVDDDDAQDVVLCSPIILPDHPQVAPESSTQFFDGTEMDEMLSLRALTLTDEEKREVRGTDPRAARLLDQVEQLPPEFLERLHGAARSMSQGPRSVHAACEDADAQQRNDRPVDSESDAVLIGEVWVHQGHRVLLRPGPHRADAQDIFLAGRTATVTRVLHDLDGKDHLAVLLDDDPGRDIARMQGRFLYFAPDEVEPLGLGS